VRAAEEQLQQDIGDVPLKKMLQVCTLTSSFPRGSRAAALLHAVMICSKLANAGVALMRRAI